jgi:hypothetical protein
MSPAEASSNPPILAARAVLLQMPGMKRQPVSVLKSYRPSSPAPIPQPLTPTEPYSVGQSLTVSDRSLTVPIEARPYFRLLDFRASKHMDILCTGIWPFKCQRIALCICSISSPHCPVYIPHPQSPLPISQPLILITQSRIPSPQSKL